MDILERVHQRSTNKVKGVEESLRELRLFSLEKRRLRRDLINVYKYLMRGCTEEKARLFSVPSDKTTDNGHIQKHGRFPLNIRKHFFYIETD